MQILNGWIFIKIFILIEKSLKSKEIWYKKKFCHWFWDHTCCSVVKTCFIKPCCGFKSPSLHLMKYSHEYTWLIELLVPVSFLLWQSGWSTRLLIWSLIFLLGGWWVNTCTGEIWNTSSGWNHKMKLHWSFFSCDCNQIKCHKTTRIH